jgi:hypothetical protein
MVHNTQNYWMFWTSSIVRYSRNYKTQHFGNWISFYPQVGWETPTLLGFLERANLNQWTKSKDPIFYDFLVGLTETGRGTQPRSNNVSSWKLESKRHQPQYNSKYRHVVPILRILNVFGSIFGLRLAAIHWHICDIISRHGDNLVWRYYLDRSYCLDKPSQTTVHTPIITHNIHDMTTNTAQ